MSPRSATAGQPIAAFPPELSVTEKDLAAYERACQELRATWLPCPTAADSLWLTTAVT